MSINNKKVVRLVMAISIALILYGMFTLTWSSPVNDKSDTLNEKNYLTEVDGTQKRLMSDQDVDTALRAPSAAGFIPPIKPQEDLLHPDKVADDQLKLVNLQIPEVQPLPAHIAVLVIACNRPSVSRALDSLLKYKPRENVAIIVSQDCGHEETSKVIKQYSDRVLHIKQPDQSTPVTKKGHEDYVAFYKISRHYKWALSQVFDVMQFQQAIVVEDDMEIAPDFYDYFQAFLPVLEADDSLFCISAWNDNGKPNLIEDPYSFYRSDFFPGLGWMLKKQLWTAELRDSWPQTYWDDWLRHSDQHKQRGCIRPEISRTMNFGKVGSSGVGWFEQHVATVKLNLEPVKFEGFFPGSSQLQRYTAEQQQDRSTARENTVVDVRNYLGKIYETRFMKQVYELSSLVTSEKLRAIISSVDGQNELEFAENANILPHLRQSVRNIKAIDTPIEYDDVNNIYYCGQNCRRRFRLEYKKLNSDRKQITLYHQTSLLEEWGLLNDIREDCARTAYKDIVTFKIKLNSSSTATFKSPSRQSSISSREGKGVEYVQVFIAPERT
ncbi:hypothetical protein MIR68_004661 [Amoeboaphelidium protococcarum]|nr:hypothetical protein MIR68_004661 [Amoeboaphelidium protococcarum]